MKRLIKIGLFIYLACLVSFVCSAQQWTSSDAVSEASGRINAVSTGIYSALQNQAGLAGVESFSFSLNALSRFAGLGLNDVSMITALPSKSGVFGLDIQQFGYQLYRESKFGLAYGRNLAKSLSIGLQLNYLRQSIPEYGSTNGLTAEGGLLYHPSDLWLIGIHLYNISFSKKPFSSEIYPVRFSAGFKYSSSASLDLLAGIEKELSYPLSFRTGAVYRFNKKIFLRTGLISYPFEWSFGLGYSIGQWHIDASTSYHQWLGISPMLSLSYATKK